MDTQTRTVLPESGNPPEGQDDWDDWGQVFKSHGDDWGQVFKESQLWPLRWDIGCSRTVQATDSADQILFEVTEGERVEDPAHLLRIFEEYKRLGFRTAIDDFGAGYSGLNLLAFFRPDMVKLDMALLRGIDADPVRKAIVEGVIGVCRVLGCQVIAEGVETVAEYGVLRRMGVSLFQGFLFARPGYEILPEVAFPD